MIAAIKVAREDRWSIAKMPQLHRLRGQTCGLLGCGEIGSLLAGKVSALGMRVTVCDPYVFGGVTAFREGDHYRMQH
jgi:phosphoglycerate dehydrogenase-like enzyme